MTVFFLIKVLFSHRIMVRTYVRTTERCQWREVSLQKAISAVKEDKVPIATAAIRFDVPRTTLRRHLSESVSKPGFKCLGRNTVLGNHEIALVEHLHNLEKMGFGMTPREVREVAFDFCKENGIQNMFDSEKKLAGEDWFSGFRKRHPNITLRKPTGLSLARANSMNRAAVKCYFKRLNSASNITGADRDVSRVYNCDESGLSMVPGTKLIVGKTGRRVSYQIQSSERGVLTTIMPCFSASGYYIPPFVIFKGKRLPDKLKTGFPHGTFVTVTKSGYMDKETFLLWMKHFQKHRPNNEEPALLVLDGHGSHCKSSKTLEYAVKHKIEMVCLPPHTTHWTQPLDRTFFKPLKSFYRENCRKFMRNHPGRALTRDDFSAMFTPAYLQAATMHNAITGFRITGICPFDENVFSEECFAPCEVTSEPQPNEHVDTSDDNNAHKTMDDHEDLDDPNIVQDPSENKEMHTSGVCDEIEDTGFTDDARDDTEGNIELDPVTSVEHSNELVTNTNESLDTGNFERKTDGNKSLQMFRDFMPLPRKVNSTPKRKSKTTVARRLTSPENIRIVKQAEQLAKKKEHLKLAKVGAMRGKNKIISQINTTNVAIVNKQVKGKNIRAVCKTQPVALFLGPSTSGINRPAQSKKSLTEQNSCGKCEGDFYDDEEGEPWIQCRSCELWFHEICAGVYGKAKYDFICDECAC